MVIQISQILQILSNLKLPAWIIGSIISVISSIIYRLFNYVI